MSVQPSLPSWKVEVHFVAPQFRIVVKCPLRTQKTTMNSVSPYYVNLILSYSYFVCHCSQWVDTSSIQQFLNLTSPDFLSYPFNLTLDLHCNFVFRMEIRWWQTKLDVKTLIFKHLWAIDLHDQRPSSWFYLILWFQYQHSFACALSNSLKKLSKQTKTKGKERN